jgi:hypothetical protein
MSRLALAALLFGYHYYYYENISCSSACTVRVSTEHQLSTQSRKHDICIYTERMGQQLGRFLSRSTARSDSRLLISRNSAATLRAAATAAVSRRHSTAAVS